MIPPGILMWVAKNWKLLAGAAIIGVVIIGVASLYGAYQVEKGLAVKYKAERDAARIFAERWEDAAKVAIDANIQWAASAELQNAEITRLKEEGDRRRAQYLAERRRRLEAQQTVDELNAEVATAITSEDCWGAIDQMIKLFRWEGER